MHLDIHQLALTLIMYARGMIIKSSIKDNSFRGILVGPLYLFSSELIMSSISILDM